MRIVSDSDLDPFREEMCHILTNLLPVGGSGPGSALRLEQMTVHVPRGPCCSPHLGAAAVIWKELRLDLLPGE